MGLGSTVCDKLRKPLEKYTRRGSGGSYSYHKGSDVIRRLNDAFGHSWSSERVEAEIVEDQVLMLVSLMVFVEGDTLIHHGYGSSPIARHSGSNKIVDIGNTYKSAFTNALKKAAEQFGIGLGGEEDEDSKRPRASVSPSSKPAAKPSATLAPSRPPATKGTVARPAMKRPAPLPARTGAGSSSPSPDIRATAVAAVTPRPAPAPVSEPVPTPDHGDEMLTDTQKTALKSLSKLRDIEEVKMVQGALPGTSKTMFKELLKSEAIQVIRFANKLPPQG